MKDNESEILIPEMIAGDPEARTQASMNKTFRYVSDEIRHGYVEIADMESINIKADWVEGHEIDPDPQEIWVHADYIDGLIDALIDAKMHLDSE